MILHFTTLVIGNILNGTSSKGFQLDYLTKLRDVKDTQTKKSLLHHIVRNMLEGDVVMEDMAKQFEDFGIVSRTNIDELQSSLGKMEDECKRSMGYLKIVANYEEDTHQMINVFLVDATKRILNMKKLLQLVLRKYSKFLSWLGITSHLHSDYTPMKVAAIFINFCIDVNNVKRQLMLEQNKEIKRKVVNIRRSASVLSLKSTDYDQQLGKTSKSLFSPQLRRKEQEPCLEEYLGIAPTEPKRMKGKRRPYSWQSSTSHDLRYSRTLSKQMAVIE